MDPTAGSSQHPASSNQHAATIPDLLYYELTPKGLKALGDELAWWQRFVVGVAGVIDPA